MNGYDIGAAVHASFVAFVAAVVVITAAVTAGLIFGLPWLWDLIKPWLHSITGRA